MPNTKLETAGLYLELYVGIILLFIIVLMLSGMVHDRQDIVGGILTLICATTGIFAGILGMKKYWQAHITAIGTSILVIVASYVFGFDLNIMAWIAGGNIAVGGICALIGAEK